MKSIGHLFLFEQSSDYSLVEIHVPENISKKIKIFTKQIDESDLHKDGIEKHHHITVRYGLVEKNEKRLQKLFNNFGEINITLGDISLFKNDGCDVLKITILSNDVRKANKVVGNLPLPGETYKDYNPHITIAYLKSEIGQKYLKDKTIFNGIKFKVNKLYFSSKNDSKNEITLT